MLSMILDDKTSYQMRIIHELPKRIRIHNAVFHDPEFDPVYMEAILQNIPGVKDMRFNIKAATVVVAYDGDSRSREQILQCLRLIPLEARTPFGEQATVSDPVGVVAKGLLAFLAPVVPTPLRGLLSWLISLPTLVEGIETLILEGIKVKVLDATSIGISLLRTDYYTVNYIVALMALGEYLEQISEESSTGLLKNLLRPQVEDVRVERDKQEIMIVLDEVIIGDIVVCLSGEMIPVDGIVVEGEASINQSSITGESIPVHVKPESEVLSGSVIEEGRIKINARQVGSETSLARINRFLENSLRFKSQSQKKSDELADRLVPLSFGLGVLLYALTRDIRRAASVLTVDYSCAIKLSNPVAVKTAMYTAAHSGVLLKGSQALDSLARVDTIVFDKTGTLTRGALEITEIIPVQNLPEEELLTLAAGAEQHYTHPIARAVAQEAGNRGIKLPPVSEVDFIVAHGVSAYVNGKRVLAGSRHFIEDDEGINCSKADIYSKTLHGQGKSLLFVANEDVFAGVIVLKDTLRPEADRVLHELKAQGIKKIVVLTGDHQDTAKAVAAKLEALDEIHWELKPEDKAAIVEDLHKKGHIIAFAGDGVNDAPALVTADVGICMPGGAELARESAQVILLRDDLDALVAAREIAGRTQRIIKNCFLASFGMNSLFLLLAAGNILPPVVAAILHNSNTVGILGYAALAGMRSPKSQKTDKP